jgi:hypothetical protein
MKLRTIVAVILLIALLLPACSNLSKREQRVLTGGAIGAGAGAAGAVILGGPILLGTAVGAAAGAVGGAVVDAVED